MTGCVRSSSWVSFVVQNFRFRLIGDARKNRNRNYDCWRGKDDFLRSKMEWSVRLGNKNSIPRRGTVSYYPVLFPTYLRIVHFPSKLSIRGCMFYRPGRCQYLAKFSYLVGWNWKIFHSSLFSIPFSLFSFDQSSSILNSLPIWLRLQKLGNFTWKLSGKILITKLWIFMQLRHLFMYLNM